MHVFRSVYVKLFYKLIIFFSFTAKWWQKGGARHRRGGDSGGSRGSICGTNRGRGNKNLQNIYLNFTCRWFVTVKL